MKILIKTEYRLRELGNGIIKTFDNFIEADEYKKKEIESRIENLKDHDFFDEFICECDEHIDEECDCSKCKYCQDEKINSIIFCHYIEKVEIFMNDKGKTIIEQIYID
jgi:hypothetical protein